MLMRVFVTIVRVIDSAGKVSRVGATAPHSQPVHLGGLAADAPGSPMHWPSVEYVPLACEKHMSRITDRAKLAMRRVDRVGNKISEVQAVDTATSIQVISTAGRAVER